MKLLVIRPQPGADTTAARIEAAGGEAVVLPLFEVKPVAWNVPSANECDAVMITSANAVRQAGERLGRLANLPVYAVGSVTAQALAKLGIEAAFIGEAGVEPLLKVMSADGHRRALWLAGEDHMEISRHSDILVETRIVYRSTALPMPEHFAEIVKSVEAVMLHSALAARYFAKLCDTQSVNRSQILIAALSSAIAESAGSGWQKIAIATAPNDAALLLQVQSCFTNVRCDP